MKSSNQNTVLKGKYKGREIKDGKIVEKGHIIAPPLICEPSHENIESYTIIDKIVDSYGQSYVTTYCIIEIVWKDGDKSLISMDASNYVDFITAMY